MQIKGRGGASVRCFDGPRYVVFPALADLDRHPVNRHCLFAFRLGSIWLTS